MSNELNMQLLNCPFCGRDTAAFGYSSGDPNYVYCTNALCMGSTKHASNHMEAALLWNTRPLVHKERIVTGYMCGIGWQHELGEAEGGNKIYPSQEECEEYEKCTHECGIVEVDVHFKKWVKEQKL